MGRTHEPGEAVFRSILPEEIEWKPFPAFPPSVRLAVVVGTPSDPGPYVIRVKVPSGVKMMPHRHPEDRIYTVMSGVFYIGLGDAFVAYPPGSVIVLPGDTPHFHWAKSGEDITQVTAIGPLGLQYLDPKDDPRTRYPPPTTGSRLVELTTGWDSCGSEPRTRENTADERITVGRRGGIMATA